MDRQFVVDLTLCPLEHSILNLGTRDLLVAVFPATLFVDRLRCLIPGFLCLDSGQ